MENQDPPAGTLSWRLSSHPGTLLVFLSFRIGMSLDFLADRRLWVLMRWGVFHGEAAVMLGNAGALEPTTQSNYDPMLT